MSNPLCHFEFLTNDIERCKRFYANAFNWDFGSSSIPGYTLIRTHRDPSGGIMHGLPELPAPRFVAYFMVEDIAATLEKVQQAGGEIVKGETPVPHVGAYALFRDPDGNVLALFQPR